MNGQIPRGLLTRDGKAVNPTARLPSLRKDPLSSSPTSSSPVTTAGKGQFSSPSTTTTAATPPLKRLTTAASSSSSSTSLSISGLAANLPPPASTAATAAASNRTRGGAAKRTFKPIVNPTGRSSAGSKSGDKIKSQDRSGPENGLSDRGDGVHTRGRGRGAAGGRGGRGRGAGQSGRGRGGKTFIQLESNVFTGIDAAAIQTRARRSGAASGGGTGGAGDGGVTKVREVVKTEDLKVRSQKLADLLNDDFIVDTDDDEEKEDVDSDEDRDQKHRNRVKPIGWDSLFVEKKSKCKGTEDPLPPLPPSSPSDLTAGPVFSEGNMFVMQLPDSLLPLSDEQLSGRADVGLIGRIKIYASGRAEFVEDPMSSSSSSGPASGSKDGREPMEQDDDPHQQQNNPPTDPQSDQVSYSCLRADAAVTTIAIKEEDGSETLIHVKREGFESKTAAVQHVMILDPDRRTAVSCGQVDPSQHLVLVPDLVVRVSPDHLSSATPAPDDGHR